MTPFTEYYRLRSFAYQADGDFRYMWYSLKLTELVDRTGTKTKFTCVNANKAREEFEAARLAARVEQSHVRNSFTS
jgi:hypothetical protein